MKIQQCRLRLLLVPAAAAMCVMSFGCEGDGNVSNRDALLFGMEAHHAANPNNPKAAIPPVVIEDYFAPAHHAHPKQAAARPANHHGVPANAKKAMAKPPVAKTKPPTVPVAAKPKVVAKKPPVKIGC